MPASLIPARHHVALLQLSDFRNHADLLLRLDDRPVCLIGANGVGKTNILEALTMLAPGRGLRGAASEDLARGGSEAAGRRARAWSVFAELRQGQETRRLGVGLESAPDASGPKRMARLDGRAATSSDLAKAARMAWVIPAMDRLFAGPPGDRRRFLDRLTLARASEHGSVAGAYERALRERQRLLGEPRPDGAWLTGLEQEMAAHGAALAAARVETLRHLRQAIAARPSGAFPEAILALEGDLEAAFEAGGVSADIEEDFARSLRAFRGRDGAAGRALLGPHRSDLLVRHGPKDMPASLSSTGEQKALLLGIVIAHVRALSQDPGAGPALLLLDEAGAHLDAARREALAMELLALPGQSWLTGTDASLFEAFDRQAQRFWLNEDGLSHAPQV